jgi:uncharacterized FlgJ-related protein
MKRMFKNTKVKYLIFFLAVLVLSIVSFGVGTFKPNYFILNKITERIELEQSKTAIKLGLHEPEFVYNSKKTFTEAVRQCVQYLNFTTPHSLRIPSLLVEAQAGLESGWGTSRFAIEGNALFGVRTWNPKLPQMKPKDNPNAIWGVKVYKSKCQSIEDYIDLLNTHSAYEEFRILREEMMEDRSYDFNALVDTLDLFSTNPDYTNLLKSTIKQLQVKVKL